MKSQIILLTAGLTAALSMQPVHETKYDSLVSRLGENAQICEGQRGHVRMPYFIVPENDSDKVKVYSLAKDRNGNNSFRYQGTFDKGFVEYLNQTN